MYAGRPAHALVARRLADAARLGIDRQPEVEHHHAPVARDQHVARLQIAMQLARCVNRADAGDQLRQRRAQPRLVEVASGAGLRAPCLGSLPSGRSARRRPAPS